MKIIKRDGRIVEYNREKIYKAILRANNDVLEPERVNQKQIDNIIKHIEELNKKRMLVEDVQDMIETELMKLKKYELAKAYIIYRYKRALVRKSNITDESILSLIKYNGSNLNENNNKDNTIFNQRNLIASIVSKDLTKRILLPEKISEAHNEGIIYFHNLEYFLQPTFNCCLLNYKDMLENGTKINNILINPAQSFQDACSILSQIIINALSCQYGGITINIKHLSKYLKLTEDTLTNSIDTNKLSKELIKDLTKKELSLGINQLFYQINSLKIVTDINNPLMLYLTLDENDEYINYTSLIIEEIFNKFLLKENTELDYDNCFQLVYNLNDNNNLNTKKYYYITQMAIKYLIKHHNMSIVSEKIMKEKYNGYAYSPMNDGYLLPPYKNNYDFFEGRFNQGTISLNLVQIALASLREEDVFWKLLDERLDLCFEALMCRYHALLGTSTSVSPIHWQHGGIARLHYNDNIDSLLKNGYSTLTLGYTGLIETIKFMKNVSPINQDGEKFALKIVKYLRSKCDFWKKETGLGFCLYGIANKEICKYFLQIDKDKYGIIKEVTDKKYYTNSDYNQEKELFTRLQLEKKLQDLSNGGYVVYINNLKEEEIENIIEYIYNNILYVEFINIEN